MPTRSFKASDFSMHQERSKKLRRLMVDGLKKHPAKRVAVLLSSGVDSHACLFAALEAGKQVTCYSFCLENKVSTDYKVAKETASIFGLPFVGVKLPVDLLSLKLYILDVVNNYNDLNIHVNKTSIECLWPMWSALSEVIKDSNQATVLGMGGDVFFCTTRNNKKRLLLDQYEQMKEEYFKSNVIDKLDPQATMTQCWLKRHSPKHSLIYPFHVSQVFDVFKNMHPFDPGCRPIQKAPVRFAFWDYFQRCNVRVHQSYQKGDTGISEHFHNSLIVSDWNTRGLKSVTGIYNDVETQIITSV
jgi:asparagine synthetase B (glutamine-hydrolysing)